MSVVKISDAKHFEIDKSKPRQKHDDTIATVLTNRIDDTVKCVKMENPSESSEKPTELCLQANNHLMSSVTSSLADTPGDSGVLCLDSEASEATSQALMCHSLIGAEELTCDSQCDPTAEVTNDLTKSTTSSIMTHSDIDNQNIGVLEDIVPELLEAHQTSPVYENLPDVVLKALESEKCAVDQIERSSPRSCEPKKSLSEDIVYRRRCRKKSQSGQSSQKKRVSFHEDILNNTKTDNIHIERGFVSYGPDSGYCDRFKQRNNILTDRNSWCASGDKVTKIAADVVQQTKSEILTYGDGKGDHSGLFEYCHDSDGTKASEFKKHDNSNENTANGKLYGCDSNSSDSNFSCDSESSSTSSSSTSNKPDSPINRKCDKTQKSYSCDGFESKGHVAFMRKTYFSEADIDQSHDRINKPLAVTQSPEVVKSVLKKKRYITTNVVEENKNKNKVLKLLRTNNLIDSLKGIYKNFNFNLSTEKGLPESSMEITNVVEALHESNQNKNLSKSLDSGFQIEDENDFVEIDLSEPNVTLKQPKETKPISDEKGSPRHKLTLNMKGNKGSKQGNLEPVDKYVVNSKSTVYEHKGVSYSYVHDTFQTAFDAPKQAFVPIPDVEPCKITLTNNDELRQIELEKSKSSTPKRVYKNLKEEVEFKNGVSKHLSSPKKQNVNRYGKKGTANVVKSIDESDNCSNTDNSTTTLKGDDLIDEIQDFFDSPNSQKLKTSKSALLSRYLKTVYQKKDLELKIRNNKFFKSKLKSEKSFPGIIYPFKQVSEDFYLSAQRMSRIIDKEVIENKRLSVRMLTADEPSYFDSFEDNVAMECSEKLRLQLFSYPDEILNRMMKVQSPYKFEDGSWSPLLVFITDYALYVAAVKTGGTEYDLLCRLPHDELDAIAVGPESQYIQIIDIAGNIACSVVTGEASLGARLASSLEWSARTSPLRPQQPPAIIPLSTTPLLISVAKQRLEKKLPQVLFYGRACSGDSDEPLGVPGAYAPPLEGYLMCRIDSKRRFDPCYFLLRKGVLQWGPHSPDGITPLPNHVSILSVAGVRPYIDSTRRPHCFEIALNDSRRLSLAAPDDHTASSWLQSLLLHAAQALEEKDGVRKIDPRTNLPPPGCTVLVTEKEVFAVRDTLNPAFIVGAAPYLRDRGADALLQEYIKEARTDVEILACGSIRNLTSFKIPVSDDNWCCLEWSVCEARELGSRLALVFASSSELERFIAAVEFAYGKLSSEPFPLSVVDESKSVCEVAYAKYESAWSHMLPAQN